MIDSKKDNSLSIKKIFKIVLGFGIFSLLFFGLNQNNYYVYAQTQEESTSTTETTQETLDKTLQETKALLDIVLKIIYMVSRPLLVIAGNAMDNSLVYGSVFHLDAPLWKFRNIMKNFANYTLGFVLLYQILKGLFSLKGIDKNEIFGIIKKILLAGILIQASRFILSAVVDISTIATYAIGGMPLTILKNSNLGDQKILGVNSSMNLSDTASTTQEVMGDTVIYRTYGNNPEYKISDCRIGSGNNSKYIIGKKINFIEGSGSNTGLIALETGMCILGGLPYTFNEFPDLDGIESNQGYKEKIDEIIGSNPTLAGFEECGYIIPIFGQLKYNENNTCLDNPLTLKNFGAQGGSGRLNNITGGTTLSTLIDKSKGFVGPLITIYSSTLNFGQLIDTDSGGDSLTFGILLKFLIKTLIGIMLILPILALAIIMLARIGILRVTIAFIPILIIDQVFGFKIFDKMEYLKTENIIKLIFAPVIIVFGLSIALIFMSTLSNILGENKTDFTNSGIISQKESTLQGLGITQSKPDCYTVLGTWTFCTKLNIGGGLDNISYLLINIFGIAIMWSLLFLTIKQTGSIGEKIGKSIKEGGEKFAGNIPIVPIPGGERVGISQIAGKEGLFNKIGSNIETQMSKANREKLEDGIPSLYPKTPTTEKEGTNNTPQTNNPPINTDQINKIVAQATAGNAIDETKLKELVGEETTKQISGGMTNRIKEPENIKLIYKAFEDKGFTREVISNKFEHFIGIKLEDIKSIKDYKADIPTKDINTIITDLNAHKLEALVTIALDTELELTAGSVKKKYKIKKNGNNYEPEEVVPPVT
ncbi:MAG: hypothetical protein WAZ12_03885 [Candidatus Absconditicoccaceae bacterium]